MKTLLLVAHGSPDEHGANHTAIAHGERIRRWGSFDAVRVAFVRGTPKVGDVVESIEHGQIIVVPLFTSDGFIAGTVVPRTIEDARRTGVSVRYTSPVGTHPAVANVAHHRALSEGVTGEDRGIEEESGDGQNDDQVTLALIGHGSTKSAANRERVYSLVSEIQNRRDFESVSAYFLEENPRVDTLTRSVKTRTVVAVPLFMSRGHHVNVDIPRGIGFVPTTHSTRVTADGLTIHYTEPVGTNPVVAAIAMECGISAATSDSWTFTPSSFETFPGERGENAPRAPEGRT